jgi:maleylacetate reductase
VAFGIPLADALPEAMQRLSMQRIVVVSTNSLSGPGRMAETVCNLLESKFCGLVSGIHSHSPRADVIRVTQALREADADGVVTIGGGSVCDSVKGARLCLANGIADTVGMDRLRPYNKAPGPEGDPTVAPSLPFIAIPTTLSAAEFTPGSGITDERGPFKQVFIYPGNSPDIVLLDPEMTLNTPARLFFGTGMRAVDHCIESWCSINANPIADAHSLYGAQLLISSLEKVVSSPNDLQARLDCQTGSWLSVVAAAAGVKSGASHGIGHALGGTADMAHGETSCVMLAHILRYNASVNADRQAIIARALGHGETPLAEIITGLVKSLSLPTRLRDAGVSESILDAVANAALHDPLLKSNPRPITELTEIKRLLRAAW